MPAPTVCSVDPTGCTIMADDPKDKPRDRIMGVRDGDGAAQYGGSFGGGQSGGGAHATPHGTGKNEPNRVGGQSVQSYHGGGQAGADNDGAGDHHAARRGDAADDAAASYKDHPSQKGGAAADDFHAALDRGSAAREPGGEAPAGNPEHAEEARDPGDRVQGSDGEMVTGKP